MQSQQQILRLNISPQTAVWSGPKERKEKQNSILCVFYNLRRNDKGQVHDGHISAIRREDSLQQGLYKPHSQKKKRIKCEWIWERIQKKYNRIRKTRVLTGEASVCPQASQNIHATPMWLIVPSLKAGKYTSNGTSCTQPALIIAGAVHLAHWFGK